MKTGTAIALGIGGLLGLLVIGGVGVGAYTLLKDKGEGGGDDAVRLAQLEQQRVAAESAARIAEAQAKTATAQAQADAAKAQAEASDVPLWERAVGTVIQGGVDFLTGAAKSGSLW